MKLSREDIIMLQQEAKKDLDKYYSMLIKLSIEDGEDTKEVRWIEKQISKIRIVLFELQIEFSKTT